MNVAHMVTRKARVVTYRVDNPRDAKTLPHVVRIDHDLTYEANVDGEAQDALKPEVVAWLDDRKNVQGHWMYTIVLLPSRMDTDPQTGVEEEVMPTYYQIRFAEQRDAFAFKIRWY